MDAIIEFLFSAFGCMVIIAFWIAVWYVFLTRKDSSLRGRKAMASPLTGNGGGHFISLDKKSDQPVTDVVSRIRSEGF